MLLVLTLKNMINMVTKFTTTKNLYIIMYVQMDIKLFQHNIYYANVEPTNVPFLYILHLNCCFDGIEHTSLLVFISFIYK